MGKKTDSQSASKILRDAFAREPNAWEGVVFRYLPKKYEGEKDLMSGVGAYLAGARWNPIKSFHAIYCSSDHELAHREYFASCRAAGLSVESRMPLYGTSIRVNAAHVIDLRDSHLLQKLGITEQQIMHDGWKEATDRGEVSLCQSIGIAAWKAGFQVMLVPSAQALTAADFNVVLIKENFRPGYGKWKVKK